ncbi:MAG: hypothetical protein ACOCZ8_03970 [Bacteroidota bacterium]
MFLLFASPLTAQDFDAYYSLFPTPEDMFELPVEQLVISDRDSNSPVSLKVGSYGDKLKLSGEDMATFYQKMDAEGHESYYFPVLSMYADRVNQDIPTVVIGEFTPAESEADDEVDADEGVWRFHMISYDTHGEQLDNQVILSIEGEDYPYKIKGEILQRVPGALTTIREVNLIENVSLAPQEAQKLAPKVETKVWTVDKESGEIALMNSETKNLR